MSVKGAKWHRSSLLMLACSATALAHSAMAQPAANAPAAKPQGSPSASADNGATIGEVIVTAQRFSESAQRTALSLSVISSEELRSVTQVTQLSSVNPGVQITTGGGLTQTFIRGVGSAVVLTGQESAIAYNVDGVYLYSSTMITPEMYDLERVEVLKGPQGTLYGRNASGGAINLVTTGASLGKKEGYIEGELGNYMRERVLGAMNVPLSDTLAVRIAAQHVGHDGYLSDGSDDQNLTAGRLRLRWEPSSDVTLQVGADVSHQGGRGAGSTINPNTTGEKWVGGADPRANSGITALFTSDTQPSFLRDNQWSVNAQLDVNLGFATLTVLPAYRRQDARYLDYNPGFGDNQKLGADEKTIEVRLSNRSDALKWVLGAYYFNANNDGSSLVDQNLVNSVSAANQSQAVRSYAAFGEATFSVTDAFRLTGGLRYTHEKTDVNGENNQVLSAFPGITPAYDPVHELLDFPIHGHASAGAVTWKAGVEYDLTSSSLLFANVSRGFKGGGTYANNPGLPDTFKPEYLTAFVAGSRNRFFDNTLQVNGELFYWKLKDQQQTFLANNAFSLPVLTTANAGKAHMYGGNVDIIWRPTSNDTLHGAAEYTKSEYDSFVRTLPAFAVIPTTLCAVTPSGPGPLANTTVDCSGQPVVRSPKWAASAGYEHRFDLANGAGVIFNGDMTYASGSYLNINYLSLAHQDAYALFNASLTFEAPNKATTLTAWVRNIGDKQVFTNAVEFTPFYTRPSVQPPRTYGVTLRYSF